MFAATRSALRSTTAWAWGILLLGSIAPEIAFAHGLGGTPGWFVWSRVAILLVLIGLTPSVSALRPLRSFIVILLVLHLVAMAVARIRFGVSLPFDGLGGGAFSDKLLPEQLSKLVVSAALIATLALLEYSRARMFLVRGNLNAPIRPVWWLGFPNADSWVSFGGQYSVYFALGMGAALWITSGTSASTLSNALPALPMILAMAALNAFNEEVVYRCSILATLEAAIGQRQAWFASALLFGIAHYYGVPYGWTGVALASFMGWFLAKAVLETRGLFWAWWIHFLQEVVIFIFIAAGTVRAGG